MVSEPVNKFVEKVGFATTSRTSDKRAVAHLKQIECLVLSHVIIVHASDKMEVNMRGFTLIELLIVIGIIGILGGIVLASVNSARDSAYFARTQKEVRSMADAIWLYQLENGDYPPDANRNIPPGIEQYLGSGDHWPDAPWPDSVYDWDNWEVGGEDIFQISIRFCPQGGTIDQCNFPEEDWASDFEVNSAVYYCLEGPCRSHASEPVDYPGYCMNCGD